jgi:hypothetical protein
MKKFLVGVLMMMVFAVVLPLSVSGQDYCRRSYRSSRYSNAYYGYNGGRRYRRSYSRRSYRRPVYYSSYQPAYYSYSRRPSFYRRHRNAINIALGTGGGALLGGLLGGRRGALAGALLGAGGSALYTYKLNPKRRYYR